MADKRREMLRPLEPSRQPRRGNAQRIGRHIVEFLFIQHGVERARDLLALVDLHALRMIDGHGQHIPAALLFKFHVPQGNAGLLAQGLYQLFHTGDDLLCLQSRPSFSDFPQAKRKEWLSPLLTVTSYLTTVV